MTISTQKAILAAAVATGGTFTVGYPAGRDRGSFAGGVFHRLSVLGRVFSAPEDMTLSFGASSVTVTYNGATTLPAGSPYTFQFDDTSFDNHVLDPATSQIIYSPVRLGIINLGSPIAGSANSILLSASVTAAVLAATVLTGSIVSGGVAVIDARTGRNIVAAWTGTSVLTVTGTDMYGKRLVESSASGTTFAGKKAFKTITNIQFSADVTLCTIGTGNVLGLPVYMANAGLILRESENGATATAGTIVAGLTLATKPTATTADNRGTYTPNSTPDGSKAFTLLAALQDHTFLGAAQFAG